MFKTVTFCEKERETQKGREKQKQRETQKEREMLIRKKERETQKETCQTLNQVINVVEIFANPTY